MPLAMASASSSSANVVTVTNGPNTSSRHTRAGSARTTVGLDVAAVGQRRVVRGLAAGEDLAALVERDLDVGQHPVAVHRAR